MFTIGYQNIGNKLIFKYLKTMRCKYYTLNIVYIT